MNNLLIWVTRSGAVCLCAMIIWCTTLRTDPEPLHIMYLGDSITQGDSAQHTYASYLTDSLHAHGVNFELVGSVSQWGIRHEGHYGWRADSILLHLGEWTRGKRLDIVLCHLGTNDLGHECDVGRDSVMRRTIGDLEAIIDTIRIHNPFVSMYIAQIIPHRHKDGYDQFKAFNAMVAEIGPRKSSERSPVYVVDHFSRFSRYNDLRDDVHPDESGAEKMAKWWFEALAATGALE